MKAAFLVPEDPKDETPNLRALREARALKSIGYETEFTWVDSISPPPLGKFLARASYQLWYSSRLAELVLRGQPKADIIIAHDLYTLPGAVKAAKRLDVPLIYDAHEDWPLLIRNNSKFEARMASLVERRYLRHVSHALTPMPMSRFEKLGVPTTVLYNARPISEVEFPDREISRRLMGYEDDFVVGYIGAMEQLLNGDMCDILFRALDKLDVAWKCIIVGGPSEDALIVQRRAAMFGPKARSRVHVWGRIPFERLDILYQSLDLGLVLLDERPNYLSSLPNKLFDYMAHRVPVLAPDYPNIETVVRESDAGMLLYDWQTPRKRDARLLQTLKLATKLPYSLQSMGRTGRDAFLNKYAWDHQAPKFVNICQQLCASPTFP